MDGEVSRFVCLLFVVVVVVVAVSPRLQNGTAQTLSWVVGRVYFAV